MSTSGVVAQHSDPGLPGLHIALDRDALLELLAERLPECADRIRLLDARVDDVQYTPGSSAHVLLKLRVHDLDRGRTARQRLYVRVLRPGEAPPPEPAALVERYRQLRAGDVLAHELPLHTPWLHIPTAGLVVHAYPLDPELPTLLDVTHAEAMRVALHRAWQARGVRVRRVRAETLSYTPGARVALAFDVLAEHRETSLPELRRLVGKLHVNRAPARLFAGHWAVWLGSGGRGVAPPTGYISLAQLSLQEFLQATRLSDLAGRGTFIGLARKTAHVIARIHALTLPVLSTRGVDKELAAVDRWTAILSRLRPAHTTRLERLRMRLRRELADRVRITGTVHADFHLANVLVSHDNVSIIDWDQVAHGDPMVDVARVLASLRVSSLRVHSKLDGFADVEATFLETYLMRTHDDERRARLFEAAALLISAAGPFRLQRAGWEEGAELMLDEVERVLDRSVHGDRRSGTASDEKRQLTLAQRHDWALDRTYAQALLVPIVHAAHGSDIELTECLPRVETQSEEHLHLRWELKGYRGPERWRGVVDGLGFAQQSGRGVRRRLEQVARAPSDALALPRPLGYLEPLRMIALAPPAGTALLDLFGGPCESRALHTLANALARFHALELELDSERATARDIESVERRINELRRIGHPEADRARATFDEVRNRMAPLGERRTPTIRGADLQSVRIDDGGAGLVLVEDVLLAEPLMSVAALLVQLRIEALRHGLSAHARAALASAYLDATGEAPRALAACEALLLLDRICSSRALETADPLIVALLAAAASLLDVVP